MLTRTSLISALTVLALFLSSASSVAAEPTADTRFVLAIHGGLGIRPKNEMTPEVAQQYEQVLRASLEAGYEVLASGGTSVDAVEAAIKVMEDSPMFNAGRGSSFNREGIIQMDSSIMDGKTSDAGAVAVVQRVRNPITLARAVMEKSPHVLIADVGALQFAQEQGLEIMAPHYFHTDHRWESLQRRLNQGTQYGKSPSTIAQADLSRSPAGYDTVGAVALDRYGNLAAGTSTGGREGKLYGRVGDSPIIGAGTYANNATMAVSSTGLGEYVIRVVAAKEMSDLMEYKGLSLEEATRTVMKEIEDMGGSIGVVSIDRDGNVAMPFAGDGMKRGYVREDGDYVIKLYEDQ